MKKHNHVLVVGSIALDTVQTPVEAHADLLGGSASYASLGASFFSPVNLVGIVGKDFPNQHIDLFRRRNINLDGLQIADGKTFRWSGVYEWDLNTRRTLSVSLNVFEMFKPALPESFRDSEYVLLGNISPSLQHHVLDQARKPRFVLCDTMDLWIETERKPLMELLRRVDAITLNDSEARQLTNETSLIRAGQKILSFGPRYVIIKKGEHGCLLFANNHFFSAPAYPLEDIHDPTGAGDCFAGALLGYLAKMDEITPETLRRAIIYGSVVASYNVEAFSVRRLVKLTPEEIEGRYLVFKDISKFEF
jgi:sugar/nucleoside kinase (ribokinase family)